MLLNIIARNILFQNIVIKFVTAIHPSVMHNLSKIEMIKKATWHCELESIEGSYFEFGVYEGSSLLTSLYASKSIKSKFKRNFYGFGSFDEGFKYFDKKDTHPFFKEGDLKSSYKRTLG